MQSSGYDVSIALTNSQQLWSSAQNLRDAALQYSIMELQLLPLPEKLLVVNGYGDVRGGGVIFFSGTTARSCSFSSK